MSLFANLFTIVFEIKSTFAFLKTFIAFIFSTLFAKFFYFFLHVIYLKHAVCNCTKTWEFNVHSVVYRMNAISSDASRPYMKIRKYNTRINRLEGLFFGSLFQSFVKIVLQNMYKSIRCKLEISRACSD